MCFSSIGREEIGLKHTLARTGRRRKSKKFMEAIRCLILQAENQIFSRAAHPMPPGGTSFRLQLVNLPVDNSGAGAGSIDSSC